MQHRVRHDGRAESVTNAALARMDAVMAARFKAKGMADAALYRPIGKAVAIPCTVLIDRNVQYGVDPDSGIATYVTLITAFRADIGAEDPVRESEFAVKSESWIVDRVTDLSDESRCIMICTPKKCC